MRTVSRIMALALIAAGWIVFLPSEGRTGMKVDISASLKNKHVAPNGPTLVDNPVSQSYAGISIDRLLSYIWMNYDLEGDKATEIDFSTKLRLFTLGSGRSKISGIAGYELWTYPNTEPYSMDPAGVLAINYSGPFDANITVKKLFTEEGDKGYQTTAAISRVLKFYSNSTIDLSAVPVISTAYLTHLYGGNGWSYLRAGGSVNASLPRGWGINGAAENQFSLDDAVSENTPLFTLSVSKSWE